VDKALIQGEMLRYDQELLDLNWQYKLGLILFNIFIICYFTLVHSQEVLGVQRKRRISLRKNSFTHVSEAANIFPNRKYQVIHLGSNNFHCKMVSR